MRRDSGASSQAKQACAVLRDGKAWGVGGGGGGGGGGEAEEGRGGGADQDTDPCSRCGGGVVTRPGC